MIEDGKEADGMNKINWGIMGAGRIAGIFSAALRACEEANLYAIGSRTLEKAEEFAGLNQFQKAYGSYEELLADPQVDIVYVATPARYHYEGIKSCLLAGKNVLAEKPLTINAAQAEELIVLAREKKLFFMEAVWTKCHPAFLKLQDWIREGVLGEIRMAEGHFFTAAPSTHRLYSYENGGGALLDLGMYPIMYAQSVFHQTPVNVISHAFMGEKKVDYTNSVVLEYENGAYAQLSSGLGPEKLVFFYIQGTKGKVLLNQEFFFQATKIEVLNYDNQVIRHFEEPFICNGYEYEALEAMRCLREGKTESDKVPLDDTLTVMKIMDTCRKQWDFRFDFEE